MVDSPHTPPVSRRRNLLDPRTFRLLRMVYWARMEMDYGVDLTAQRGPAEVVSFNKAGQDRQRQRE